MRARPLLAWGAAVVVVSLLIVAAGYDRTNAGTFNPFLEIELEHTNPEEPADLTAIFGVQDKKDVNFGGVVAFLPPASGIVEGGAIPLGEPVGGLSANATLGLINAPCNTVIPVNFTFHNAVLSDADPVSFDDLELKETDEGVDLNGDGEVADTSAEGFGTRDFAEDKDGNGLLDAIDHWPEFIDRVIGEEAASKAFRRSAGITPVAGTPVLLQFLIFDPGTKFDLIGEELDDLIPTDPELGFPSFVLLQALGDPEAEPEPGPITDFCTPLRSTNITYSTYLDADGDGTENDDDTCPYDAHPLYGTHDADFDFLHTQCDPNDEENEEDPTQSGKNEDEDGDEIENFADNCPLEPNPELTVDSDGDTELDAQADEDEDGIGDPCDEDPANPDGLGQLSVLPKDGTYDFTIFTVGQRDADNDGIQNSLDTCPFVANSGDPTVLASGDADDDGLDTVCDPKDDPLAGGKNTDQDGDGYLNRQDNCPLVANGQNEEDPEKGNQEDDDIDSIGTACDPDPAVGAGELLQVNLTGEIKIGTGSGPGGPPSEEACPDCRVPGDPIRPVGGGSGGEETPEATPAVTNGNGGGDDGGSSSTIFIIIGAVAAAVVVIGGGAALLMRRGGS